MNQRNHEIWKPIRGFSLYQASSFGRLKTFNWKNKGVERVMKPALNEKGYLKTMLKNDDGKFCTIKVHRIIADTFIDNPLGKKEVNHIDGNKTNNTIENLEWVTRSENIIHAFKIGLCKAAGRLVVDTKTGIMYESCSDAARKNNMSKSTLQSMLTGYRVNKTSLAYGT